MPAGRRSSPSAPRRSALRSGSAGPPSRRIWPCRTARPGDGNRAALPGHAHRPPPGADRRLPAGGLCRACTPTNAGSIPSWRPQAHVLRLGRVPACAPPRVAATGGPGRRHLALTGRSTPSPSCAAARRSSSPPSTPWWPATSGCRPAWSPASDSRLAHGAIWWPPGSYTVTNRQAWTWVEVPVAGLGWVVADPTPGRRNGRHRPRRPLRSRPSPPSRRRRPTPCLPTRSPAVMRSPSRRRSRSRDHTPCRGGWSPSAVVALVAAVLALLGPGAGRRPAAAPPASSPGRSGSPPAHAGGRGLAGVAGRPGAGRHADRGGRHCGRDRRGGRAPFRRRRDRSGPAVGAGGGPGRVFGPGRARSARCRAGLGATAIPAAHSPRPPGSPPASPGLAGGRLRSTPAGATPAGATPAGATPAGATPSDGRTGLGVRWAISLTFVLYGSGFLARFGIWAA